MKSFKSRVVDFWTVFLKEEETFRVLLENGDHGAFVELLGSHLDTVVDIAFEAGKNAGGTYDLVFTGEGDKTKNFLTSYLVKRAPKELSSTWNFYSTRQKMGVDFGIRMYGVEVSLRDLIVYPTIDTERRKVNVEIYSKKLSGLSKDEKMSLVFICLDSAIGENYTECYVGTIEVLDSKKLLAKHVTLADLYDYIEQGIEAGGWNRFTNPCEIFTGYEVPAREGADRLRDDIRFGYTSNRDTLRLFDDDETWLEPLDRYGITLGFIYYDNTSISGDRLVAVRGVLEDEVQAVIGDSHSAELLGGATGTLNSYVDFIIYDEPEFLTLITTANFSMAGLAYRRFQAESDVTVLR